MRSRREYLSLVGIPLATGLSGCAATEGGDDTSSSTTTVPPGVGGGELTVEAGPVAAPDLEWTVEKQSDATEERPCRLRIALENTGSTRDLTAEGPLPFPSVVGDRTEDDEDGVRPVIVPVDSDYDPQFDGYCWQAQIDHPRMADDVPGAWSYGSTRTHTLEPGERIEGSYYLVADWIRYCFQRGDYLFTRPYTLAGTTYEWTFTLHVPSYDRTA